jgi:hypothetical protein
VCIPIAQEAHTLTGKGLLVLGLSFCVRVSSPVCPEYPDLIKDDLLDSDPLLGFLPSPLFSVGVQCMMYCLYLMVLIAQPHARCVGDSLACSDSQG